MTVNLEINRKSRETIPHEKQKIPRKPGGVRERIHQPLPAPLNFHCRIKQRRGHISLVIGRSNLTVFNNGSGKKKIFVSGVIFSAAEKFHVRYRTVRNIFPFRPSSISGGDEKVTDAVRHKRFPTRP